MGASHKGRISVVHSPITTITSIFVTSSSAVGSTPAADNPVNEDVINIKEPTPRSPIDRYRPHADTRAKLARYNSAYAPPLTVRTISYISSYPSTTRKLQRANSPTTITTHTSSTIRAHCLAYQNLDPHHSIYVSCHPLLSYPSDR
ncbi:hypothetical protein BDQ17DRAFT_1426924 [Cyathus striatus]|nr:hypothetical protein BDQ17DRAFT_1426924 [Cyathus striatus]